MRRLLAIAAIGTAAIWMSACGAPATNTNTNANSNANSKPTAAAPTADTLMAMEKQAQEAYIKGDSTYFEGMLSDKAVMSMGDQRMGKAGILGMIKTAKCDITDMKQSEPQLSKINDDTYAIVYKSEGNGTCTENGKTMTMKPMRAASVWVRNGDKWQAVWHAENEIMGAAPTAGSTSNSNAAGNTASNTANSSASNTHTTTNTSASNSNSNTATTAGSSNSNSNTGTTASAPLTPSPNTDALAKLHAAAWEAWRNKDANSFQTGVASNFIGVGPDGGVLANRDTAIKEWTGQGNAKCEGITKTSFTDAFSQSISPTVEILFGKGNSDGTCDGHKNGDLWNTAVYVKEGDAWKLAFMFEQMPPPSA